MSDQPPLISKAFQAFTSEAPQHAQAWGSMVQGLAGTTREEVISAILLGLPAAGLCVTQALPAATAAYDAG